MLESGIVRRRAVAALIAAALGGVTGCASSYAVPGRGANVAELAAISREEQTDYPITRSIDKHPLAQFPTSIAVVRVQAPGYQSDTAQTYGNGAYCIVTTRDIEELDKKDRLEPLRKLPMVSGIAPISRLLLPPDLKSDLELRKAAADLHADMLLIYTLDTTFHVEDDAAPLTVLTLGLSPNQQARVMTTAAAVLMDTRNGYVYGMAEATEKQNQLASGWTSTAAVDQTRRRTESKAFEKMVEQLQGTWIGVVKN